MAANGYSDDGFDLFDADVLRLGEIGIELLPDGASMIVLVCVGEKKFKLTTNREEVRELAKFLLERIGP